MTKITCFLLAYKLKNDYLYTINKEPIKQKSNEDKRSFEESNQERD